MFFNKYHAKYKLNNKNILKVFFLLIVLMLFLTSCLYGFIEIHYERIIKLNTNRNNEINEANLKPGGQHNAPSNISNSDMYKLIFQQRMSNVNKNESISEYEKMEIEELFGAVKKARASIVKSLSLEDANKLKLFKENQLLMRKKVEEKLNSTQKEDEEEEDSDDKNEKFMERVRKYILSNNSARFDNLVIVNRRLMIDYLKLEKHILKNKIKINGIRTVKQVIEESHDLSEFPPIYQKYHVFINEFALYNNTSALNEVFEVLTKSNVKKASEKERGTQIKVILTFDDYTHAIMKPMRVQRDYETPPDHFYFNDFERHHAEIAAFHVDKVIGFYRVPPTVGRIFNMTADIWEKADTELEKTFYHSPAGNICFTGHCSYYCDTTHAICGKPYDVLEGSVQLMLPRKPYVSWVAISNPYKRSYNKKRKADWESNENFCFERVFQDPYYQSKNILDLVDLHIFDFITGNLDRHHFEKMITISDEIFSLHLDNGRAFGKAFHDEMSILAPLIQCCLVRYSTFLRLEYLYKNEFSKMLNESLKIDPLYPILTNSHIKAVDRRLYKILIEISKCVDKLNIPQVIIDDGYGF